MGNIYYEQKKYPSAIKMCRMALDQIPWHPLTHPHTPLHPLTRYRMALDQIPSTGREVRLKITRYT